MITRSIVTYFETQGREWERYAWIKNRVIAGPPEAASVLIEQIVRPFVFRKYLDFGAYESMRRLQYFDAQQTQTLPKTAAD